MVKKIFIIKSELPTHSIADGLGFGGYIVYLYYKCFIMCFIIALSCALVNYP